MRIKSVLLMMGIVLSYLSHAMESTKPIKPITTAGIALRVLKKLTTNSHVKVIGGCVWMTKKFPPILEPGPALSQFLPDLIITVSNNPGENPWVEANGLYENKATQSIYQKAFEAAMHIPLGFGDGSGQLVSQHINDERTRVVSVIGSPGNVYRMSGVTHKAETSFLKLYYASLADAVNDRTEAGEIAYMATHPQLLIGHDIGTFTHSWGQEVPRLMQVTQSSRFRASVVAAMHAADIVTNTGAHVKISTTNSCGPNCVVANAVYDPQHQKVIWQEVYPKNRNINPGDPNDFGEADDMAGNGNYVFVLWRNYKGCVKQKGRLVKGTPNVGQPQKR